MKEKIAEIILNELQRRDEGYHPYLLRVAEVILSLPVEGCDCTLGELPEQARKMREENKRLRKLLWLHHGCGFVALYGDDGEMQCHNCMIDFKRMAVEDIEYRWTIRNDEKRINDALTFKGK